MTVADRKKIITPRRAVEFFVGVTGRAGGSFDTTCHITYLLA
jgi:hypothetical protein